MCVCVCERERERERERESLRCSDLGLVDICSGGEFVVTGVLLVCLHIHVCKTRPPDL